MNVLVDTHVYLWWLADHRRLNRQVRELLQEPATNRFIPLAIDPVHAQCAGALPRHHDDPFDRMLIAQAQLEGLSLVTHEGAFSAYEVNLIPA